MRHVTAARAPTFLSITASKPDTLTNFFRKKWLLQNFPKFSFGVSVLAASLRSTNGQLARLTEYFWVRVWVQMGVRALSFCRRTRSHPVSTYFLVLAVEGCSSIHGGVLTCRQWCNRGFSWIYHFRSTETSPRRQLWLSDLKFSGLCFPSSCDGGGFRHRRNPTVEKMKLGRWICEG